MKIWDEKEVIEDIDEETLVHDQEELSKRREEAHKAERELSEEEMIGLMRFNPKTQIMLTEAKVHNKKAKLGDIIKIDLEHPGDFGRMAAQTAKQVIIQKLREAERGNVFEDFKNQEKGIVQGVVQRRDRSGGFIIDLGKITGILSSSEMMPRERYNLGTKMRFYVLSVSMGNRGPEIILSRKDKRIVEVVFSQEIPEIASGDVLIKGIARDAGNRSKVSVFTEDESIDPIGSCIGQRGSRITTIIEELGGEKIDIIQYSEKPIEYIKNSLSPAKINSVELNEEKKEALAMVASDQFSLAIGRGGQNVRLAAELTGWKIKVQDLGGEKEISSEDEVIEVEKVLQEKVEKSAQGGSALGGKEEIKTEEVVEDVVVEESASKIKEESVE